MEGEVLMLVSAVARFDLSAVAFRDGYAPFEPFTGTLEGDLRRWRVRNRLRLPVLQQPHGLWRGSVGYNRTGVQVHADNRIAGLPMLRMPLHWIHRRRREQHAPTLHEFWELTVGGPPPKLLYHAQGAQFSLSRAAIRSRSREFYRSILPFVSYHVDPVASYYLELMWPHVFGLEWAAET